MKEFGEALAGSVEKEAPNAERMIARTNARLRHFRGVAASVLGEALAFWREILLSLEDRRTCAEILDDANEPRRGPAPGEWGDLLEKLHALGVKIDYAKRLCEGDVAGIEAPEKEEEQ